MHRTHTLTFNNCTRSRQHITNNDYVVARSHSYYFYPTCDFGLKNTVLWIVERFWTIINSFHCHFFRPLIRYTNFVSSLLFLFHSLRSEYCISLQFVLVEALFTNNYGLSALHKQYSELINNYNNKKSVFHRSSAATMCCL